MAEEDLAADVLSTEDQDRCLTSLVLTAENQVKSHLNQLMADLYIAETVIQQKNHNSAEHKLVFTLLILHKL